MLPFYTPGNIKKELFSDILKRYRKEALVWKGLNMTEYWEKDLFLDCECIFELMFP